MAGRKRKPSDAPLGSGMARQAASKMAKRKKKRARARGGVMSEIRKTRGK